MVILLPYAAFLSMRYLLPMLESRAFYSLRFQSKALDCEYESLFHLLKIPILHRTGCFLSWCLSQPRLNGAQAGSANGQGQKPCPEMMRSASPVCDHWNGRQVLVSTCFSVSRNSSNCKRAVIVSGSSPNNGIVFSTERHKTTCHRCVHCNLEPTVR